MSRKGIKQTGIVTISGNKTVVSDCVFGEGEMSGERQAIAEALDLEQVGDDFGNERHEWWESSLPDLPERIERAMRVTSQNCRILQHTGYTMWDDEEKKSWCRACMESGIAALRDKEDD